MKKIRHYSLIALILLLSGRISFGQSGVLFPASARWTLTNPQAGGTGLNVATEGQLSALNEALNNTEINNYTGPGESQRIRLANTGNTWPANLTYQLDTVFIQFAVSPKTSNRLTIDSLALKICAMSTSSMEANIYCSKDSTFASSTRIRYVDAAANHYLPTSALELLALNDLNIIVEPGETFYLRVYPWHENTSVSTGKYICLQDVFISGQTESLRTQASVIWFEKGLQVPVISGGLLANSPFYSDSMTLYTQTTDLPLNEADKSVTAGAVQTVSQIWTAETDTVNYLYFGSRVGPKTGGTLHIDSVTMNIGGWFTSNLKAAVYYSLHDDFSNAALLIDDTQLPGNSLNHWSAPMDTNIYSGQTFYIRIYPHSTAAAGWAKLVAINDLKIYGSVIGVTADPPTVNTAGLSYLSTTFVTCGGNIPNDGGALVTRRGVVWDTTTNPTVNDFKTSDGTGSGTFISHITGLTPGKTYFVRAYAINIADTSYGEEHTFATLDSILVPAVTTTAVSVIMVKTAESGGDVTNWGGDTVKVRGICWDTVSSPTISDNVTINGQGIGTFKSTLYPLAQATTYYIRAYATNSAGTGYGFEVTFTTQYPAPDIIRTVAKDGSGDYTTVQAAFNDVQDLYTGTWTILIKPGVYTEKITLAKNKVNVVIRGEHPDSVILTWNDNANTSNGAGGTVGTSGSYSVAIEPNDFAAYKITFRNTNQVAQAVALRTNGDRQRYYHCKLKGFQDTYYTYGLGRIYMKDCFLEGAVDYIFGQATVVFDSCELKELRYGGPLTAASTNVNSKYGYVFRHCKIITDAIGYDGKAVTGIFLGRPWQGNPKVVFMYCYEPASLAPAGWTTMNAGLNPLFAEYKCFGPGYFPDQRATNINYQGIQLTDNEASEYTLENIFSMSTNPSFGIDWIPDTTSYKLYQTLDFDPLPDKRMGDDFFSLTATATSGLPVTYISSNTGVATVSGNAVTLTGSGSTEITASQEGNFLYHAASGVVQTLTVGEPNALDEDVIKATHIFPNPARDLIHIKSESNLPGTLTMNNSMGQLVICKNLVSNIESIDISSLSKGIYVLKLENKIFKIVVK